MNLKRAGRWGAAGLVGAVGTAGALAAIFLNPKSGAKRRKAVGNQTKAVAKRERAHIAAMVGVAKSKAPTSKRRGSGSKLEEAVRSALADAGAPGIDVHVRAGVVRLHGEVAALSDIRAFEAIAAGVDGVKQVDNVLRLSA